MDRQSQQKKVGNIIPMELGAIGTSSFKKTLTSKEVMPNDFEELSREDVF